MHKQSVRKALLGPIIAILVLVPVILSMQYFMQARYLRAEYGSYSHEVAMRVADLISFSYRHVSERYTDLLPAATACHEQLFQNLPNDPSEVNVSNMVTRALALLPAGVHCDVAVVSPEYRILDTTYRPELGLDLSEFPDAVAAFSEAALTGNIVPDFPVVDSVGHHLRIYTLSVAPGAGYFVQLGACHDSVDELFNQLKHQIEASVYVGEADVYLFNLVQGDEVCHIFNLRGNGAPSDALSDAVQIVTELASDSSKTSIMAPTHSTKGLDYYQQVEVDPNLVGDLPFGAVVRVRLDATAHRRFIAGHKWIIAVAALMIFFCVGLVVWSLNKTFYKPSRILSQHMRSAAPIDPDSPVHATLEFSGIADKFNEHLERIRRSESELRVLYEETDQLVQVRTSDLEVANKQLSDSEAELRFLSKRLLSMQEEQMQHIALELHDEFGQSLVAMKFMLQSLERERRGKDGGENTTELVDKCLSTLDRVINQMRSLISILRPAVLDAQGIESAIQWLGEQYSNAKPSVRIQVDLEPGLAPQELSTPIFRITQEAINNAVKHSEANNVTVSLNGTKSGRIELIIQDDGCGFEMTPDSLPRDKSYRFGLVSMRERARLSGGTLDITTTIGIGTRICAGWDSDSISS